MEGLIQEENAKKGIKEEHETEAGEHIHDFQSQSSREREITVLHRQHIDLNGNLLLVEEKDQS